jgi:hypothetical protein
MTHPAEPPPDAGLGVGPAASTEDPPAQPVSAPPLGPESSAAPGDHAEAAVRVVLQRRRDKIVGLAIVGVAFVASLVLSVWAKHASRPETSDPPGPPTTEGVPGYPDRIDVVGTLPAARELTKRSILRGIVADGVRSDGTVDVSEGPGRARFVFQSPPGRGPQPKDAKPPVRGVYCGRQEVHLRHEGLVAVPDQPSVPCPAELPEPLPDPQCTLQKIWHRALAKGVPADRLGRIEYYRANAGPAWRFEARESSKRFVLYGDCERELKGVAAAGHVP